MHGTMSLKFTIGTVLKCFILIANSFIISFHMKSKLNFYPITIDLVFKKQTRYITYFCNWIFNFVASILWYRECIEPAQVKRWGEEV